MSTITSLSELDLNGRYTYADYLKWQFEETVELIRGQIFRMSPAPGLTHQRVSGNLHYCIIGYLKAKGNKCEVFSAPFDVRLLDKNKSGRSDREVYTVVQPDLCVVCDQAKLDERGCMGAPDLMVEILSKGNSKKEMKMKYALYEEAGVREYWIIMPYEHVLQQFVFNAEGRYVLAGIFTEDEIFRSHLFPDLEIDLGAVFEE